MTNPPTTVTVGNRTVTIERPTGLKASRALALMRKLSRAMPGLQTELADFRRAYEERNVLALDRVQAKLRFPPRPVVNQDGTVALDEAGEPLMYPSPVDRLTDEDWQAAGGVYRMPASPSGEEVIAAMFASAIEVAEEHVYALVALFTIPNADLKLARREGTDDALIAKAAEDLLDDAYADELVELAVVVGETVDHHFRRKTRELGDRLGNALRLVGIDRPTSPSPTSPSPTSPSASRPNSSTDSPASTDGDPTTPSTPASTSSSSLDDSSSETEQPTQQPQEAAPTP